MSLDPIIYTEKSVLIDILKMYKNLPCLWEPCHKQYNNKEARDEGYQHLLEKYKILEKSATIQFMKKKIENMRCCYKREYKKVLEAKANGKIHRPLLWYYKYLSFLDNVHDDSEGSGDDDDEETESNNDLLYEEPPVKKEKLASYLTEEDHISQNDEDTSTSQDNVQKDLFSLNEAESFGRTIGLQLNQLRPMQRFIAEKLISDVIYYGRMDKLNHESTVTFNRMSFN